MICSVNVNFVRRPHLSTPKAVYGLNSADNTPPPSPHPCLGLYNYSYEDKLANRQKIHLGICIVRKQTDRQIHLSICIHAVKTTEQTDIRIMVKGELSFIARGLLHGRSSLILLR